MDKYLSSNKQLNVDLGMKLQQQAKDLNKTTELNYILNSQDTDVKIARRQFKLKLLYGDFNSQYSKLSKSIKVFII